ncbi:exo-beta-N-acetylmuramidase NamZ domain-containing protein [Thermodesulfobacteriota bacterium B35]
MSRPRKIRLGIEELVAAPPQWLAELRLGLLCNQASTDQRFVHSRDLLLARFPGRLRCLFSPQHGFFSEKQDNMIESDHGIDPVSGLPVYSLYGETRKPLHAMFDGIDVLLVDLVDVGTRVYTFAWTVVHCLEVAAETGVRVVILDRPNPLGGRVEGNLLKSAWSSFVGLYPVPMRHGLTLAELALLCNRGMGIGADLSVVPVRGWRRDMLFPQTGIPWVFPSPNMPSFATALVYPGQVIWEGTNLSEGRGTTLPFELFGAPFIELDEVLTLLAGMALPGCVFRPLVFEPCFGKWAGEPCQGFQLHVTDPDTFLPYRTGLALLQLLPALYPEEFRYKEPPYEYEFERLPMDLILGDRQVRIALEEGVDLLELEASWQEDLARYGQECAEILLYH